MQLPVPSISSLLRVTARLFLAWVLLVCEVPGAAASAPSQELKIQSIFDAPCESANDRRSRHHLTIQEVLLSGDEKMDLAQVALPHGWRKTRLSDGSWALRQTTPCAMPLAVETSGEWVRVKITNPEHPALIRLGNETQWLEPTPAHESREVVLGSRQPRVQWSAPRMVPYRQSLARRAALSSEQEGNRWVNFDQRYALEPHPTLPSRNFSLPARIEFPGLSIPDQSTLRFGVVDSTAEGQDLTVTISTGSDRTEDSDSIRTRSGNLTWYEIPLNQGPSENRSLVLSIQGEGELRLVDPGLRGREAIGPRRGERPNFLLITLDTVRADHL